MDKISNRTCSGIEIVDSSVVPNVMSKKHLTIILEKSDHELWGRINVPGSFLLTTVGNTVEEVTANLRDLVHDFLEHEAKDVAEWEGIAETNITYQYEYDLTAIFEVFDAIKMSAIAQAAGINQSLIRQYATGKKHPSERQAKRIEAAIRDLGNRLLHVTVA